MFKFQYTPALHDGEVNNDNNVFTYVGKIIDHFRNTTEGESFSGVTVELYNDEGQTGETRRFRFDRMIKTENIDNAMELRQLQRIAEHMKGF
jgi:hypothetical protein